MFMSPVTVLASGQIAAVDAIVIELVQANETPAAVIIRWPAKPSVLHPHRFPAVAEIAALTFAAAVAETGPDSTGQAAVRPDRDDPDESCW